jgi:hypothetical protein
MPWPQGAGRQVARLGLLYACSIAWHSMAMLCAWGMLCAARTAFGVIKGLWPLVWMLASRLCRGVSAPAWPRAGMQQAQAECG